MLSKEKLEEALKRNFWLDLNPELSINDDLIKSGAGISRIATVVSSVSIIIFI
ncbi:MAG: hypothetical protein IMF17_03210 [Proteobacteria bacterium]|nr:hypothetical protein [Pseudomonadota bacterium]